MSLNEQISEMVSLFNGMADCIDLMYMGFSSGDPKVLDNVNCYMEGADHRVESLTEAILDAGKEDPDAARYVSVPSHIERVQESATRIVSCMKRQILENILFSDKAVSDVSYLMERFRDMVVHVREMLEERNPLVAKHIIGAEKAVAGAADEFASSHEARLVEGGCMPGAASLFLEMMDAFKDVAWHAKEIAKDLME